MAQPSARPPLRRMTVVAVVVLVTDAVFLGVMGVVAHRPLLVAGGALSLVFAGVMVMLYRRHRENVDELSAARQDLKEEVRAIAASLQQSRDS